MVVALLLPSSLLTTLLSLVFDAVYSWIRMLIALALSILISLVLGIWAARSYRAGRIILPIVDIFQTLPILAFFPFAIYVVVLYLPSFIGINLAVIFLITTSMLWNMIFGVYESLKAIPRELFEVASVYGLSRMQRIRKFYLPAVMPKLIEQATLSWAIGLFYLVTSEIFAVGSASYYVNGIGVALTTLAVSGNFPAYIVGLLVFISFVIATRYLLFARLERRFSMSRQFAAPAHSKRHLTLLGVTHKVRLTKEIASLMSEEKRIMRPIEKELARETGAAVSFYGGILSIMFGIRRLNKYHYIGLLAAVAVALLFITGSLNFTTLGYEVDVLIALASSFIRVWAAFVVVLLVSIPLCVYIIFFSKKLDSYITVFQVLASIPATVVLPIIVLVLIGIPFHSELVAFAVFFLSGIWYVIFSVIAESKAIDSEVIEVKQLFGLKGIKAWKNIYIRVIIPGIITGAVTAIAAEWNASIVAEYFTSSGIVGGTALSTVNTGIGKLLDVSLNSGNLTLMVIALINLTAMIIIVNTFVWKRLYMKMSRIYS